MTLTTAGGFTLSRLIGAGGEAEVYEVADRPGSVCKHYRQPTAERAAKLRVMLEHPPDGTRAGGHVSVAWPTELVHGPSGDVIGFLMPRIDVTSAVPLFQVYNPATRLRIAPGFSWRYLVRTARNVAAIVDAVHRAGHVVGDLNESNLLVDRRALVALVDCDSMQITDPDTGRMYRSPVGKPEFLAPELHGRDLSATDRTPASDAFALAILIHQLLLEGVHPYSGVWRGRGDPPDVATRIAKGWVAGRRGWSPVDRPPHAVPARALPNDIRALFRRALSKRARRRPEPVEWLAALEALEGSLRICKRSEHHVHATRRCPWCARIDRGLPDPFPGPTGVSTLAPRGPSRARRAITTTWRGVRGNVHRTRALALTAACGVAGWTWPGVTPAAIALVLLPLAFVVLTPSRHAVAAWQASAAAFVTIAVGSGFVASVFLDWPQALSGASALAAAVQGVAVPAASTGWSKARGRLARLPTAAAWAVLAATVALSR